MYSDKEQNNKKNEEFRARPTRKRRKASGSIISVNYPVNIISLFFFMYFIYLLCVSLDFYI